jgi:hypothetical protein
MNTETYGIEVVILGHVEGNKYLYASTTAIEFPGHLYNERNAIYTMTVKIPQPK